MPLDLSKVLFLPFQHCIYMFCEQKHTTELLRNCSKQSVLLRVNVRCLSVEIFSLRLFISFRLNGPFLQRLKELEFSLTPMTHGWTNALTNKFTHIRAILQTHFWTLLNEDKDKLYSVTDRYWVTILQLLQTRVIENFWRSQKMAQLWVEHLSILSDNICKPRCFLICFYGVVFVARAITRKKNKDWGNIHTVEFPAQLFRVFMMTTFKQITGIGLLRTTHGPGRAPWKFLLWLSKLFFSPPTYLLFLWPNRKSNADITSTKTSCLRFTIYPPCLNLHRGDTKTTSFNNPCQIFFLHLPSCSEKQS